MRLKDENTALKATLKEADKGRESMIREISSAKDVQSDKIREIEREQAAQVKIQEKIIEGLRREKKDMEQRYEDMVTKYEIIGSRSSEEHHNTVKYFENLIA